ncbi:unnamed protein product, partial [Clonostachys rhizophaga]
MDMIQTLRKSYTPPAAAFQVLESPTTSTSTATSTPSSSTGSSSTSSSTSSSSTSSSASPPLRSSSKSSPADQIRVPNPSPRTRSQQDGFTFVRDLRPRSPPPTTRPPSPATVARPQNPVQEQQEPTLIIDSRHNEDIFSYHIKSGDPVGPTKNVLSQINIRIPINIISIYKAQELDLSIEDLESGDPRKVQYISSEHRTTNWKIVGKTLDAKIYSDSNAHTKPKTLSLFVAHASLDPPIILGQPFLKQSRRNYRTQ